jgi:uncharacterized protein
VSNKIVIDTNVLVGALIGQESSANRKLLELCLKGEFKPLISYTLFSEYEDLINRPSILKLCKRSPEEIDILFNGLLSVCELVKIYYLWRPNLIDEDDNHLVEIASAGNAQIIVIPICVLKRNSQMGKISHRFKLFGNRVEKVETFAESIDDFLK